MAACGGGDSTTTRVALPPLPAPEPLTSYRYEAILDFSVASPSGDSRFTGTKRGVFVAPDRHMVTAALIVDGRPGPEERVTIIGGDAWYDDGSGAVIAAPNDSRVRGVVADVTSVNGGLFPGGDVYDTIVGMPFAQEQVGDFSTRRFTADSSDPALLSALTDRGSFGPRLVDAEVAQLTIWVDEASGVIVRTRLEVSGGPGVLGGDVPRGAAVDLLLAVELSDVNDPSIEISPPP